MSAVRLVASDEQRRSPRGGDVDRGVDLSRNGDESVLSGVEREPGERITLGTSR
jgi:hypothetical protein